MAEQRNWRWCKKCQGLFFWSHPVGSICPAGGAHDRGETWYRLYVDAAPIAEAQQLWKWCCKCQAIFFSGNPSSVCPHGGQHDGAWSESYLMPHGTLPTQSQSGWRWCKRCQGLFYGGGETQGVCPAGGAHDAQGSANYALPFELRPGEHVDTFYRIYSGLGGKLALGRGQGAIEEGTMGWAALRPGTEADSRWILRWWNNVGVSFMLSPARDGQSAAFLIARGSNAMTVGGNFERSDMGWQRHGNFCVDITSHPWVAINNLGRTQVMDAEYGKAEPNTKVIEWTWNGGLNQVWLMAPAV